MGTRADYYLKEEGKLIWIGSTHHDGYPEGVAEIVAAKTQQEFCRAFKARIAEGQGWGSDRGWPWPWSASDATDYAYLFDPKRRRVVCCKFGVGWCLPSKVDEAYEGGKHGKVKFPRMLPPGRGDVRGADIIIRS